MSAGHLGGGGLTALFAASLVALTASGASASPPRASQERSLQRVLMRFYVAGERGWVAVGRDADHQCLRCAVWHERRIALLSASAQKAIRALPVGGLRARKSRLLALRGFADWRLAAALIVRSSQELRRKERERAVDSAIRSELAAREGGAAIRRAVRSLPGGVSAFAGVQRAERKAPSQ